MNLAFIAAINNLQVCTPAEGGFKVIWAANVDISMKIYTIRNKYYELSYYPGG
ncbi:MAG: hypothetical protein AB7F19_05270 [Candidatus Babeliales bacterium]